MTVLSDLRRHCSDVAGKILSIATRIQRLFLQSFHIHNALGKVFSLSANVADLDGEELRVLFHGVLHHLYPRMCRYYSDYSAETSLAVTDRSIPIGCKRCSEWPS